MSINCQTPTTAQFHLPGLFEFFEFYEVFLPIFEEHREYFYDWVNIASIYGAPENCCWSGGRFGMGDTEPNEVLKLLRSYNISARLTFSNSLLTPEHLQDLRCNKLCAEFSGYDSPQNGVIVHSELLTEYLRNNYPNLYLVSSTTKVLTDWSELINELERDEFRYVVPDYRHNINRSKLQTLLQNQKDKTEFLVNECCYVGCNERRACYETVSRKMLDEECPEHICHAPDSEQGYKFSKAMQSPTFIGIKDIKEWYLPQGFTNFKIEGRNLGSALLLEFILYYLTKPEYQLEIRELMYLDSMLNLF